MRYCFLNGQIIPESDAQISAFDEGFLYGYGVYETMRTYKQKLINWENHFNRLQNSLKAVNLKLTYNQTELLTAINQLIAKNNLDEYRIRLTVSAGTNNQTTTLVSVQPLELPTQDQYQKGVAVITTELNRPLPRIKSTNLLAQKLLWHDLQTKQAFEAIFIDETNRVLEGSRSNLFIVKDQKIYTPKKDVLPGTTARLINQFADNLQIPFIEKKLELSNLLHANEAFITNAIVGIVPINQVDQTTIPLGSITTQLQKAYQDYLETLTHD